MFDDCYVTFELAFGNIIPKVNKPTRGPCARPVNFIPSGNRLPKFSTRYTKAVEIIPLTKTMIFNMLLIDFCEMSSGVNLLRKS